jgi:hypothetical protein
MQTELLYERVREGCVAFFDFYRDRKTGVSQQFATLAASPRRAGPDVVRAS